MLGSMNFPHFLNQVLWVADRHFVTKKVGDACVIPLSAITGGALNPYDHKEMVAVCVGHTPVNNK